ncbi:MAG TPA: FAD-dependent oxidoreductase, partial [Ktedonobacteraceae bacterium]
IQMIQARAVEIDALGQFVRLANGSAFGYGSLLLATGSIATGLPTHLPGRDFDGAMTLHCLHDYMNLRRRLHEIEDAVVVGSGAHAIETVTSLLHLGFHTHWLIRGKTCLSRELDLQSSELLIRHIQQAGAKVYTETELVGIAGNIGAVAGAITNHQQMLPCQLVLVCTGIKPVTTLAEHCTLPMMFEREQGIFVNNQLRTNVPGIYAAGDVAALHNPQIGNHERRAQWYAAVVQGYAAAAEMTGRPATSQHPFGVPWHATRLGTLSLLTVGAPLARIKGSATLTGNYKGTYRRLSILNDRLVGYLSLGPSQADGLAIKRLVDEGHSIAPLKEALLKGAFDARTYFSKQHSISVHASITSGKQHVVKTTQSALLPMLSPQPEPVPLASLGIEKSPPERPLSIVGTTPLAHLPRSSVETQFRVIHTSSERQ